MKNTRGFIAEERPDLIEEWHPLENNEDTLVNVRSGSDKIIVWRYKECEHVWKTQAKSRAIKNTVCPKCHERYNVSFPELKYNHMKSLLLYLL
ncbi:zinc-ribbon domain-containing protein [Cytobacillus sp. Sa5YUA1]|uniref:Zinc-ribbon domain-containing protein n=1 Tax=Cytobacillus stercorigallinarum TaxID=2762240 RepID=A0ABR8QU48_9BACI|nr:zinc-ribbon domain-containing protein [Cytobacillus stercorigallinarum]MBD7939056.1 zinc-ribbon domain-containing protein [Cytobacillus stercorigallinarum]